METITGSVDVSGIKRFQMPGTCIKFKCPKCGRETDVELIDQIYYPGDDREEHSVAIECEGCDYEAEIVRKIEVVSVIATLKVHEQQLV